MMDNESNPSMAELQEVDYGADRDYTHGSPHLAHDILSSRIKADLTDLVRAHIQSSGRCRVLEVGAGHGTFTGTLAEAGATVTVTEMSAPSVALLESKFAATPEVTIVHDPDGDASLQLVDGGMDLLVFVSVLHHIPNYVAVVSDLVDALPPGGSFYCVQDPMWYPDRSRANLMMDKGAYFVWRLFQGDVKRGFKTRARRMRKHYDEAEASDMVEYHVVRQGVNENALEQLLSDRFDDVALWTYWSTQSSTLQRLGDRLNLATTFGLTARGRR